MRSVFGAIVLVLGAILAVACNNGDTSTAPIAASSPADATPPSLAELATKIACQPESRQGLFAREAGGCDFGGGTLRLVTFSSTAQQNQWLEGVRTAGAGVPLVGDLWAANCSSSEVARAAQQKLGGEIR